MKSFTFLHNKITPLQAMIAVHDLPYSLWFDSNDQSHRDARYSYVCAQPLETIETYDGETRCRSIIGDIRVEGDPFDTVKERLNNLSNNTRSLQDIPPFQGGAAGYFGYDLGRQLEKLPNDTQSDPDIPDMAIGIYDMVYAFDHKLGQGYIIVRALHEEEAVRKYNHMKTLISRTKEVEHMHFEPKWKPRFSKEQYTNSVQRMIDYIHAGDIFQANMTQRFDAELPHGFDPFAHYLRMRFHNAAPFASFMNLGGTYISSSSPERFLQCSSAGNIETRPIKGTRPRHKDPQLDNLNKRALMDSEKDHAENAMIVDLLRNDLSRVCEPESIDVKALCELESFASVHHLVSTITGRLQNGKQATDLLKACFPGGSITGAPKIRAMEIIEEIEETRRGPYCGAAGFIGFDGAMDTNIMIRTLILQKEECVFANRWWNRGRFRPGKRISGNAR